MRKRILSLFMALVMLFSLTTPAAWAAEDPNKDSAFTNGYYDESGKWTEGGTGTIQYKPDENTTLNLSKTAKVIGENEFEITLTVQAKTKTRVQTNAAAVVLVIDTSGSMQYCANCGGEPSGWWGDGPVDHDNNCPNEDLSDYNASRMKAAKDAAKSFLETYAGTDANAARWLSIVDFDDYGNVVLDWVNVAGGAGKNDYNDAVDEIDDLAAGGGTNLDDGLYDANAQMSKSTVADVTSKSVIALTDGVPTYYRTNNGGRGGNGQNGSATINTATANTAATLRSKADLYTVCFGVANDVTYEGGYGQADGPTVGNFLKNSVATSGCAYNADNTTELMNAFKAITEDITEGIESKQVSDPMGKGVSVIDLPSNVTDDSTATNLTWELQDTNGVKDGDYTVYTYTLTYRIELDATAIDFDENEWHPANGVTTLKWSDTQSYDFPVPGLKGVVPVFTVKYQQGEHGVLMVGDTATDEVVHPDLKMHTATPEAPTVEAADGYWFTGWSPVVTDTVTKDVTYVAQYAPKTVITVTAISGSKEYNGAAQSISGYSIAGLDDGYNLNGLTATVSGTNVGTYTNKVTGNPVITKGEEDVTEQFTVKTISGKLEITKRPVTLTSASDSKVYDGTALTNSKVTAEGFVDGEGATYDVTGSQTYVGTSDNTFTYTLNSNTKAANYDITTKFGTLTVTPITTEIVITADSNTKVYDGTALTDDGYTFTQDVLVEGDVLTAVVEGTITNVGEAANVVTSYKVMRGETDVTANYTFGESVDGKLTITKRPVTLTSASDSKVYDGTPLTNSKVTVGGDGFVEGEGATYDVTGSQTYVGTSDNTFTYTLNEGTSADNYDITVVEGKLTVTTITDEIVITADSNEKVYDGTALTDDGYTFTQDVLVEGDVLTAVVEGTITNVGEAANVVTSYKVMRGETDVTANYTFGESVDGKLTITKRPVTLTSATDSKVYDGTALTNDTVTVTGDGFVAGEGASYDVTGSQTYVGTSDNTFTYTLNEGTSADNYDITVVEGKLTVTAITDEIVITADSNEKVYDGTALTDDGYTYAEELLAEGDVIVAVVEGTITDVGSADNVVTSYKVMRGETDVTENYTGITTAKGTLTITKRPVTITSPDAEKVYDGTALVNTNVTSEGFVEGEGASYIVTGSQLNVGSSVNEFTYTLNEGTKADNYTVTVVKGTLTVTPVTDKVTVTITEHSGEEVYDGTEKTVEGYDVAIDNALYTEDDFAFEGNDSVSGIYAGTYEMELKAEDFANTSDNFTNVEFVIVDGALVIKPVETEIVITADSNEKVYDGTALTDDGYTYDQSLLVEGDYIVAVVEGSQTDVGSSANVVTSYKVLRDTGAVAREIVDVTDCYANVTTEDGTLTVTKRPVTLTSGSDSKVYDGTALTKEEVTVTGDGFVEGEGAAYSQFASITEVGSTDNTFTYTLTEGTKADNYDITVVEGVLTVNKHTDAKLEATGYTGVYDGKLHDGVTDKAVVGGVEGDEWTYTYSIDGENFTAEMPQYQDVGTYTVYVKATNPNYEGDALTTTVPVVITPATIVVTADDHTIATGDADPELTYQVSTPVATETPAFDGFLVREEGTGKGEYAIEQGTLALTDGEGFKASNYVLEFVPGTLTILQRAIDVEKTVDVEKAFVGDTLTYTFVVTNTGEVDLKNVVLVDEMLQIAGEIGALAIGESWTGTATYVATAEDVGKTLINTVMVLAEGDTFDEDDSEGTVIYAPVPQTGDEMPLGLLSGAMLVSLAGVIVLLLSQRKNKADQAE